MAMKHMKRLSRGFSYTFTSFTRKPTEPEIDPGNFRMNYSGSTSPSSDNDDVITKETAIERVASLIGDDINSVDLFCQMDLLRSYRDDLVWKEMARWVRYEEAVEEGGKRWSKPHVSSLAMDALQDLQGILSACPVLLDVDLTQMSDIVDAVLDAWQRDRMFAVLLRNHFRSVLLKRHKYQDSKTKKGQKSVKQPLNLQMVRSDSDGYINSGYDFGEMGNHLHITGESYSPSLAYSAKGNKNFMRKIPRGAEVVNLLVGEVEELDRKVAAFVRLKEPRNVGDITEVQLETRFLFFLLGPKGSLGACAEITRCMAALFTDEIFRCVAYKARERDDIIAGIREFSANLTVLPPGSWDPSTRIEPPEVVPSQEHRKGKEIHTSMTIASSIHSFADSIEDDIDHEDEGHTDPTLVRTGRLFGGLVQDVKRKIPHYVSDFKDCLHVQCIASFFFLFLVTLTPNVTFGGLLGQVTHQYMGTMECILAASISGIMFALFAGQPLNILGSTGPMLVLEGIIYNFCSDQNWEFMPFRVWVGLWTALFIFLVVAFDLSALVKYITRFTEESFACLIALIFIYQAFKKTFEIEKLAPVHFNPPDASRFSFGCLCLLPNSTYIAINRTELLRNESADFNCSFYDGTVMGEGCDDNYVPDVFFISLMLFIGTFTLSIVLVNFKNSLFFPTWVRQNVSAFGVLISIIIMVVIDAMLGLPTPKLNVPTEFAPSRPGRPWFINPISDKNPWWLMLFSAVPALLATILIFMDQQITAVIVNRAENKLKKGSGYHLDMLIVGVLVVILSFLGLPWYVAATVTALAHVMSLKKESECTAPGEKPIFLGVREQRVTALLVGIFSGLAVFITSVLNYIPMPVLYGVFLYMGVAPLGGMQLIQRILLAFMPAKYQPDYNYLRHVPIGRVHLFTAIQVLCLAGLWVVKSIKSISVAFPLMVLIICFARKGLDKVFTQRELKWLDDILPSTSSSKDDKTTLQKKNDPEVAQEPEVIHKPPFERSISAPPEEVTVEKLANYRLKPRYSLPFVCKTDLDMMKEESGGDPHSVINRRLSLISACERKRSIISQASSDGAEYRNIERKFSTDSSYSTHSSSLGHMAHVPHGRGHMIHDKNKNVLISLPDTISDVNEDSNSEREDAASDNGKTGGIEKL